MVERVLIDVTGLVQGVGFRPYVYSLATLLNLRGSVQNIGGHLAIDLEGEHTAVDAFLHALVEDPPSLASIRAVETRRVCPANHRQFQIRTSTGALAREVHISPDIATCERCLAELFDPNDRRHRHPFISCTKCGPRYSIIVGVPFDRPRTTMGRFAMCEECLAEFANPRNRRFHAQTIACWRCGPTLVARDRAVAHAGGQDALTMAVNTLCAGGIVAVKGLGGFHLACDATNEDAVRELRLRKHRHAKPFAMMLDEPHARSVFADDTAALAALLTRERPIVLLPREAWVSAGAPDIAESVAPGCPSVGLMLPYTPVHHLLLHDIGRPLVMTSGNISDEPMAFKDEEALGQFGAVADIFLMHDREIQTRCDDSVVRIHAGKPALVRRARGFAPSAITLEEEAPTPVLGVGAHLKNTFCLIAGRHAYMSPHIGDLDRVETYRALGDGVSQAARLFGVEPTVVAHDLHPDYLSTRVASELPAARRLGVQHHHAHVLSCIAEHSLQRPVIGVAFDGAGLGTDGAIWGGEFLFVDGVACERLAHLAYVPLAGGDLVAREPWRMAVAHLTAAFGDGLGPMGAVLRQRITPTLWNGVRRLVARGMGTPTSSVGRLFDALASLLGLRDRAEYEGQAAMELESIASVESARDYVFDVNTTLPVWAIQSAPVIRAISADLAGDIPRAQIACGFHRALGTMVADVASRIAAHTGVRDVVLTGGVFQNAMLTNCAAQALEAAGLTVFLHERVPCNDGGLSLGQALFAARTARAERQLEERVACA